MMINAGPVQSRIPATASGPKTVVAVLVVF